MKRLLFLLLFITSVGHGQGYFYSRSTPGGPSLYRQIMSSDLPNIVADVINDGVTTTAPSQNAVYDALSGKQPLNSNLTTVAGLGGPLQKLQTNSAGTAVQWVDQTFNPFNNTGQLLVSADGIGTPGKIDAVATGNVLTSAGTSTVPVWGKVNLGTMVSGLGTAGQYAKVNAGATGIDFITLSILNNPMTTTGDVIYSTDNSGTPGRLGIAASGNALISGATPSWGKISLTTTVSGILPVANGGTGSSSGLPINSLTSASGAGTFDNGSLQQNWQWNSLTTAQGLYLSSSSSSANSNSAILFRSSFTGANTNSNQLTRSTFFHNVKTGTGSTNVAVDAFASSGTNNLPIVARGAQNILSDDVSGTYPTPTSGSILLEMQSTARGFLPSRMTTTQRNAIASPVDGLMIANTTTHSIDWYNGSSWNPIVLNSTYTPTLTSVSNIGSSTAYVTGYYQVGTMVTVFGKVDITPTAAASTASELGLSLPVTSNLVNEQDLGGTAESDIATGTGIRIKADGTNDRASLVFKSGTTSASSYNFQFSYQIK